MNLGPLSPYAGAVKAAMFGIAGLALVGLGVSWHMRGQEVQHLRSWQSTVTSTLASATHVESLRFDDVNATISTLGANVDAYQAEYNRISNEAELAQMQSLANDAQLQAELHEQQTRYQAATARIEALERRPKAASPDAAAKQIEDDSKAAWSGWNQ